MPDVDYTQAYSDKKARQFAQVLYGVLFFNIFTMEELCAIVQEEQLIRWKKCERRSIIFEQGACDTSFYIVIQGAIDIRKTAGAGKEQTVGTINKGEVLGEMVVCNPETPRRASAFVTADESAILCEIDASLLRSVPQSIKVKFLKKFLDLIIERLKLQDEVFQYYEEIILHAETETGIEADEYFTYAVQTAANDKNRLTQFIKYTDFLIAKKISPANGIPLLEKLMRLANTNLDRSFHTT